MALHRGKGFESKFSECWRKSFPKGFVYRIPDQMSGYLEVSQNPCDFFAFANGRLFLVECKSHKGNSFPISNQKVFPQYSRLVSYMGLDGVHPGVMLWLEEKDLVAWLPIESLVRIKEELGLKSVNSDMIRDGEYGIIEIPSKKLRVFMDSDYRIMKDL